MSNCIVCHYPFQVGQRGISVSAPGVIQWGEKSQTLYIERDNDQQDIVHECCVLGYFNPEYNQNTFEAWEDRYKVRLREECFEEVRQEAEEAAQDHISEVITNAEQGKICIICQEELDGESQQGAWEEGGPST